MIRRINNKSIFINCLSISISHMQLRLGEFTVDKLDLIEDTKENASDN